MSILFAIYSGLCASFASLFGKISGLEFSYLDFKLRYTIKIICFCLMILLNSLMWTFFVKALHSSKSSLEPTVISTAINYICSGILGYLAFREVTGLLWWIGISFLIIGVIIIHKSTTELKEKEKEKK